MKLTILKNLNKKPQSRTQRCWQLSTLFHLHLKSYFTTLGSCKSRSTAPAYWQGSQARCHIKLHQNLHSGHLVLIHPVKFSRRDQSGITAQLIWKENTVCMHVRYFITSVWTGVVHITVLVTSHTYSPALECFSVSLHTLEPVWPCYTLESL